MGKWLLITGRLRVTALRPKPALLVRSPNGSSWPLCKALHNGHYVKFPFMHINLVPNGI